MRTFKIYSLNTFYDQILLITVSILYIIYSELITEILYL